MSTFKTWAVGLLFVLMLCVDGWGCGQPPPSYYSVDGDFSDEREAEIDEGFAAWCAKVDWCPEKASWTERGRVLLVSDDEMIDRKPDPSCRTQDCFVAAFNRNATDQIHVSQSLADFATFDFFWISVTHEIGHFGNNEHSKKGLMSAVHDSGATTDFLIDEASAQLWCEEQPCN